MEAELTGSPLPYLHGVPVDMPYTVDAQSGGVILDQQHEISDLQRWSSERKTSAKETRHSERWRENLDVYRRDNARGTNTGPDDVDTLRKLRKSTNQEVSRALEHTEGLENGLNLLGFSRNRAAELVRRWGPLRAHRIQQHAPYTFYLIAIEFFLRQVMKQWPHRGRSRADFMYFFYLPYCHIFASNDKTQLRYAKVCMNSAQELIDATVLRRDLEEVQKLEMVSGKMSLFFPPTGSTGVFAKTLDRRYPEWKSAENKTETAEPSKQASNAPPTVEEWIRLLDEANARGTRMPSRYSSKGQSSPS